MRRPPTLKFSTRMSHCCASSRTSSAPRGVAMSSATDSLLRLAER
ncbi:Uncharacterised protein [Bordetella pertussis]|nr:Uncharacterised protein [Bordetella pertussis]CFW36766.1 Uncharacterised protein [Bordetella pertussis]